jgi:hypothetical protein
MRRLSFFGICALLVALSACSQTRSSGTATTLSSSDSTATAVSSPMTSQQATPAANAQRVDSTVKSISENSVALDDGTNFSVTDSTRITRTVQGSASDLKIGAYVAITAKRQTDNTLLASLVNILADSFRGVAAGQRPLPEGNLMTNATIDSVDGSKFTVSFPGGGAQVQLAPDGKVTRMVDTRFSDVQPGTPLTVTLVNGVAQSMSLR